MGAVVQGSADAVRQIGVAGGHIRRFAEAVQQAHQFGIGPGSLDEPWTIEFQSSAMQAYLTTLPIGYLSILAERFEHCADLMITVSAPIHIGSEWTTVQQYLRATSRAVRDFDAADLVAGPAELGELAPDTPPVMAFNLIAELMSESGALRLAQVAAVVEAHCGQLNDSPLTEQETQWMRSLALGKRTIDIATESGYSERSLYRILGDLWDRLKVENRNEAILEATKQGWI